MEPKKPKSPVGFDLTDTVMIEIETQLNTITSEIASQDAPENDDGLDFGAAFSSDDEDAD